MAEKLPVGLLFGPGTQCHRETAYAFEAAGANPNIVPITELRAGRETFDKYKILVLPGGFLHADVFASGKLFAVELTTYFADQFTDFTQGKGRFVLGICNGAQVLARTGLVPFGKMGDLQAAFTYNKSGHFDCRRVNMTIEPHSASIALSGISGTMSMLSRHGEGYLRTSKENMARIENEGLVVGRYCMPTGEPTSAYPYSPNGSEIAAICNPDGNIVAIMPHPETDTSNALIAQLVHHVGQM